ncbi:putative rRNA maturation factor [Dysgonomonadaceae bacterium PH5-43]|nr:putative rRNA maturation factor [Dysgonomonadaceae bacterium PH5-43]
MISYCSVDIKFPTIKRREVSRWVKAVANTYNKRVGEIAYIFCSDEEILRINKQYLEHDYYTDIITFDYSEDDVISGDLFISLDTVKSNSEKFNTKYEDELYRVIIHGILHLCGLKDKQPEEERIMRNSENGALELLKTSKEELKK